MPLYTANHFATAQSSGIGQAAYGGGLSFKPGVDNEALSVKPQAQGAQSDDDKLQFS